MFLHSQAWVLTFEHAAMINQAVFTQFGDGIENTRPANSSGGLVGDRFDLDFGAVNLQALNGASGSAHAIGDVGAFKSRA